MVKTYKVGESLKLRPIEMGKDSNDNDYLTLLEGNDSDRTFRVYINSVKFDEEELPSSVPVVVSKIDCFERLSLRLDFETLFKEHYELGKTYRFTISDKREDPNTQALYYIVSDAFAEHRYYTQDDMQVGDECVLLAKDFNGKGFLIFESETDITEQAVPVKEEKKIFTTPISSDTKCILDVEDESSKLELKTSIAFPPGGNGEADIDKQLDNIIRVICAFMNTEGGELYIGVKDDTKQIVGIAEDYKHLNDSTDDEYQYKENHDGYKLKIRNTIDRKCTSVVNSLIEFSFAEQDGLEYCVIKVKKAKRPVWFNGVQLWIRQGCRNKQLKGDDITLFVTGLMTISIQDKIEMDDIDIIRLDSNLRNKMLKNMIYTPQNISELPPPPALGKIDYWINWLEDGSWKRTREKATDRDYCIQIPVLKNINDPRILFCYKSGSVNCMKLSDFRRNTNMNNVVSNRTWNAEEGKPVNVLIASSTDLLFGFSVDYNGIEYVKFHDVADFNITQSTRNKGGRFVPENYTMTRFFVTDSSVRRKLAQLQCTRQQRSQDAGKPINSPTFQNEISILMNLLHNNANNE